MPYHSSFMPDFSARDTAANLDPLFRQRWSPRAFKKMAIAEEDLHTIFEAARWSPSCFNEQPWRFYSSTPQSFDRFLKLLNEKNQQWARGASVIGFIVVQRHFSRNDKENRYAAFDTGAAWMAMTLQARLLGLYTHGMAGILHEQVYDEFAIDRATHEVICGFVIGALADAEAMTPEQAAREIPNGRRPLTEIWHSV